MGAPDPSGAGQSPPPHPRLLSPGPRQGAALRGRRMALALLTRVLDRFRGRRGTPEMGPGERPRPGRKEGFAMGPRLGEGTCRMLGWRGRSLGSIFTPGTGMG